MHHINQYQQLTWFLVAYFFYIDGVDTIFTMATIIGKDLGIQTTMLMVVLLVVQLIAVPFHFCMVDLLISFLRDELLC